MDKNEFEEIRRKAEEGDAEAQFNLGNCYYDGYGVEQNYEEAVKWYCMCKFRSIWSQAFQ